MSDINLTDAQYETAARTLLASLENEGSPSSPHVPAPGPAAPSINPLAVPAGFTLRETYRNNPDGSTELIRELVRDAAVAAGTPRPAPATVAAPAPTAIATRRTLPEWLADNSRNVKAGAYLAGGAAVTTVGAVYGDAIAAGIAAGAGALWSATLTVLKVVGVIAGIGLLLRFTFGGRSRRPRTGTFDGTLRGTWRQD
ncbi:hypothetical protein ABZ605_28140 [Streptomyces sp. NPDC012765]|uniref:hypothetical protein n=1 Tax=Streptomyces sp. NPDC012765 TaxID=3155249 RepID=UPI0033DA5376